MSQREASIGAQLALDPPTANLENAHVERASEWRRAADGSSHWRYVVLRLDPPAAGWVWRTIQKMKRAEDGSRRLVERDDDEDSIFHTHIGRDMPLGVFAREERRSLDTPRMLSWASAVRHVFDIETLRRQIDFWKNQGASSSQAWLYWGVDRWHYVRAPGEEPPPILGAPAPAAVPAPAADDSDSDDDDGWRCDICAGRRAHGSSTTMNRQDGPGYEEAEVCLDCDGGADAMNQGWLNGMFGDSMMAVPPNVSSVHEIAPDVVVAVLEGHALTSMVRDAHGRLEALYTHSTGDAYVGGSGDVLCSVHHDAGREMCVLLRSPVYFDSVVRDAFAGIHPKRGLRVMQYFYSGENPDGDSTFVDLAPININDTIVRLERIGPGRAIAFSETKFYLITIEIDDVSIGVPIVRTYAPPHTPLRCAIADAGRCLAFVNDRIIETWRAPAAPIVDYIHIATAAFMPDARSPCNWGAPGTDRIAFISRSRIYVSKGALPSNGALLEGDFVVAFDYTTAATGVDPDDDAAHLERLVPLRGALAVLIYKLGERSIDILREGATRSHTWRRTRIAAGLDVIDDVTGLSNGNLLLANDDNVLEFSAASNYAVGTRSVAKQ